MKTATNVSHKNRKMSEESRDWEPQQEHLRTRREEPFRELMRRHLPMVHAVTLRISGDPELAAEASQDVSPINIDQKAEGASLEKKITN